MRSFAVVDSPPKARVTYTQQSRRHVWWRKALWGCLIQEIEMVGRAQVKREGRKEGINK